MEIVTTHTAADFDAVFGIFSLSGNRCLVIERSINEHAGSYDQTMAKSCSSGLPYGKERYWAIVGDG